MMKLIVRLVFAIRPHLPLWLIGPLVRWRIRRALDNPAMLELATTQMEFLLAESGHAEEIPAAARRYVAQRMWATELRWHPRAVTRQPVEGIEHLERARDEGRGVILNFMHHGHYDGSFASVARAGVPCHMLAGVETLLPTATPNLRQHMRVVGQDGTIVSAAIGLEGIIGLLREGHVVAVASDVPGSSEVSFVGRRVLGSSGAVRAAITAGAPVVVMTSRLDGEHTVLTIHPKLDSREFDSPQQLLDAVIAKHEPAVLAWPEGVDSPTLCWGTPDAG